MRAKNLDPSGVNDIVALILGWENPLSWKALVAEVEVRTKNCYTRQALHRHPEIRVAFSARKGLLARRDGSGAGLSSGSLKKVLNANSNVERLEQEISTLKVINDRLLAQFAIWAYNAHLRGVTQEMLNEPLPKVERDATTVRLEDLR